jgi:transposase
MLPTTPARRTHDYVRNGTTSLFAAFDLASGSVIAQPYRQHRHQEFLKFLKVIDKAVPKDLDLHLVLDNYATHKTPEIKAWLLKHPRFRLHFTPTSSSWMNLVERWFSELTNRKLRRSAHRSVTELEKRHPQVDQRVEQAPQAVRLDQVRRRDPRDPRRLL